MLCADLNGMGIQRRAAIELWGLSGGSNGKESACNAGDTHLIPGLGRVPGERNGNPLQYSDLENSMDRGAWKSTVYGVTKSQKRLRDFTFTVIVE